MTSPLRLLPLLSLLPLLLAGCGAETEPPARPPVATAVSEDPFSGLYRVEGRTVDEATGESRAIAGTMVLREVGGEYLASSELHTRYPRPEGGEVEAAVIGTGRGRLREGALAGTAETQLVLGTLPGVDTGFAFVPRDVGPRIVSQWRAELARDGSLRIELRNAGGEGERYRPTRTTLRAERVAAAD